MKKATLRSGRRHRAFLAVLSVLCFPVDLLRLTFRLLDLTFRLVFNRFLSWLSMVPSLTTTHYPCRAAKPLGRGPGGTCFVMRRSLTRGLLRWCCGCSRDDLAQAYIVKKMPLMVKITRIRYARMALSLALIWGVLGWGGVALRRTSAALARSRDLAEEYVVKADVLLSQEAYSRARIQYLNAIQQRPEHVGAQWGLAQAARKLDRIEEAERALHRVVTLAPTHEEARAALTDLLLERGDARQALAHALQAVATDPDNPAARVRLGECHRILEDFAQSLEQAGEALERVPDHPPALVLAAASAANLHDCEAALFFLERLQQAVPASRLDRLAVARILAKCERYDEARHHLERLIAREGDNSSAVRELAELRLAMGSLVDAIGLYQRLDRSVANTFANRVRLAELLLMAGQLDEAYEVGKTLSAESPQSPAGSLILGTVYYLRDLWSASVRESHASLRLDPRSVAGRTLLARALMRQGHHAEALPWLRELAAERWRDLELQMMMAECHVELAQRKEAFEILDRAMALHPASEMPHLLRARLYLERRDYGKAITCYELALQRNPDHFLALNNLASLLSSQETGSRHDVPEAWRLASMAWNLSPGAPEIAETLGWILTLRGEHRKAFPLLSYSARKQPRNPTVRLHLAHVLTELDRPEEASGQLEYAMELSPGLASRADVQTLQEALRTRGTRRSAEP